MLVSERTYHHLKLGSFLILQLNESAHLLQLQLQILSSAGAQTEIQVPQARRKAYKAW